MALCELQRFPRRSRSTDPWNLGDSQVAGLLRRCQDEELGHPQRARNINKVLELIALRLL